MKKCKFRFQGAERHTWCECGKWEGFTGNFPNRAEHKALWEEHRQEKQAESPEVCRECLGDHPRHDANCCERMEVGS